MASMPAGQAHADVPPGQRPLKPLAQQDTAVVPKKRIPSRAGPDAPVRVASVVQHWPGSPQRQPRSIFS